MWKNMKSVYKIKEYGSFVCEKEVVGYQTLPEPVFRQLEDFILRNCNGGTEIADVMGCSLRKGVGKLITAKNYVGTIMFQDGSCIEILPKIHSSIEDDEQSGKTREILLAMLKTLQEPPYKSMDDSLVDTDKISIFEVFIRMFVREVSMLVKGGLRCGYERVEENTTFFKGKLMISQQIRWNYCHEERSYVTYDAFTANRAENRILKATLLFLYKKTSSSKTRKNLRELLLAFSEVPPSTNYASDFGKCVSERNMEHYRNALAWSRVFLMGKSFTSFAGSEMATALLFPMETLFESYVAALVRKRYEGKGYRVSVQDKTCYLFDEPKKAFQLKPDIVLTRESDGEVFLLDTKWKLLDSSRNYYGIAQSDMYQMFAYQKKYGGKRVILLYPRTNKVPEDSSIAFQSEDGTDIRVEFIDLFDAANSIAGIARQF